MINLFTRYHERERQPGGPLFNMEWRINNGGYVYVGKNNWTFAHSFYVTGNPALGEQRQFLFRGQVSLDNEPRQSFLTFEFWNPFEARIIYFWMKVWPGKNFKIVLNLGWRLTLDSQRYLKNRIAEIQRIRVQAAKVQEDLIQKNGGISNVPINNKR